MSMAQYRNNCPSPSTIVETLKQAHYLHETWEKKLKKEPAIDNLIEKLKQDIAATQHAMRTFGVLKICKQCEEKEGGSCCCQGIELKYNAMLLLINLILGVSFPKKNYSPNSCFFLGEKGCVLIARHVLCVNYLCSQIKRKLTTDELIQLQNIAGEELYTAFKLHDAIKNFIGYNHEP